LSGKKQDKLRASSDQSYHAVTADLQSVLSTSCSNVSSLYYARKLAVYNFTIFDQASHDGVCMLWDETTAQRGSNEIGSLLYRYLQECVPDTAKHVVITSDSTAAQNRNKFVMAMLLFSVQILPNVDTIEQKFLEPEHTEMEVDSMHSAIDAARKNVKIMVPSQWQIVMQMARRKNPYRNTKYEHL
jgi:hypothetical protein